MIKPIELANVCAIFPSLHTSNLSNDDLHKHVQSTKLIDSDNSTDDILNACVDSGLLRIIDSKYGLSKTGKKLIRNHTMPGYELTKSAKEIFIKNVLLDLNIKKWCCGEFISNFEVDTMIGSFVYRRDKKVQGDTNWLIILNSVGLIQVDLEKATLNTEYLGLINEFLGKFRNPDREIIIEKDKRRKEIGDLAEALVMDFEKNRLKSAGYEELSELIEHISLVDQSAGYDIKSFKGDGTNPGETIFIEVKGTTNNEFGFIWSFNEMNVAKEKSDSYWIYGYTNIDLDHKTGDGPITIEDPSTALQTLGYILTPLEYRVTTS